MPTISKNFKLGQNKTETDVKICHPDKIAIKLEPCIIEDFKLGHLFVIAESLIQSYCFTVYNRNNSAV